MLHMFLTPSHTRLPVLKFGVKYEQMAPDPATQFKTESVIATLCLWKAVL
jgi:hypothetical protein